MHFSIHYVTEYHYSAPVTDNLNALRVRPTTTATQRCDEFHVRIDPETRLGRHADYFGTEVIEFGISSAAHRADDRRARPRRDRRSARAAGPAVGRAGPRRSTSRRRASTCCRASPSPPTGRSTSSGREQRRRRRSLTATALCELIPERFEYVRGVTYVGSTVGDLLEAGGGVCQDFVHLALILLRRHGIARPLRLRLPVRGAPRRRRRLGRGRHPRLARAAAARTAASAASRSGSASTRPTARAPTSATSRSATAATTTTCRRSRASTAARRRRAVGERRDDAPGPGDERARVAR